MLVLVCFLSLLPSLLAFSPYGQFSQPADRDGDPDYTKNQVWVVGSVQQLKWQTTLRNYNMTLFQEVLNHTTATSAPNPIFVSTEGSGWGWQSLNWTVDIQNFDLNYNPVFFIQAFGPEIGVNFTSPYFNITRTKSSNSTTTPTPTTTANPNTTATATATSKGLSKGAKIGLGLGIGLGIPILLALALLCCLQRRRRHRGQTEITDVTQIPYAGHRAGRR